MKLSPTLRVIKYNSLQTTFLFTYVPFALRGEGSNDLLKGGADASANIPEPKQELAPERALRLGRS